MNFLDRFTRILSLPATRMPDSVIQLGSMADPYLVTDDALFIRATREVSAWHDRRFQWYRTHLRQHGVRVTELRSLRAILNLPPVHANFFRPTPATASAGTAATPSLPGNAASGFRTRLFFDSSSSSTIRQMMDAVMTRRGALSDKPANYLVNAYEPYSGFRIGAMNASHSLMRHAPVANEFWSLRVLDNGMHAFDLNNAIHCLQAYAQDARPTRIVGLPDYLLTLLRRMEALQLPPLRLPADSWVIIGRGGQGEPETTAWRSELSARLERQLGIPREQVTEILGAVDHETLHVSCSRQHFHVPTWSRAVVRDVHSLQALPYGTAGALSFISPCIASVPAHNVVTDDIAILHRPGSCTCGNPTAWFDITGRRQREAHVQPT